MTPAQRKEMYLLCTLMPEERDPRKFEQLVCRLNELLAHRPTVIVDSDGKTAKRVA